MKLRTSFIVLTAALTLTACGGGSDDNGDTGGGALSDCQAASVGLF